MNMRHTTARRQVSATPPTPARPRPASARPRPALHALARVVAGAALVLGCGLLAQTGALAQRASEPITLNFVNAEIESVARAMAAITGRNVVVDPRVKGSMTLVSERPMPPQAAYNQFLAALRLQGYAVVEVAGLYKVVPEADAKLQGAGVAVPGSAAPGANQIVTQIFRLSHETANNLVPVLRPLISPNNTINVNPGNNSLIITDYSDNLQRLARIIAALDVSNATDVEVIPLQHGIAADLAPVVARLVETSTAPAAGQGQADTSFRTTVLAESRTNALLVRAANPARLALVRAIVERLDQPGAANASGNIHVVYLRNADATKLATTLRAALASAGTTGGGALTATGGSAGTGTANGATAGAAASASTQAIASSQPSTGGQIQADAATNSLIISAPEPVYRQLRAVIERLDQRRAQVFVESLIAEVSTDRAAEFGIQWQGLLGNAGGSAIGVMGTNFGAGGNNIINLSTQGASGNAVPGRGINLGMVNQRNGVYVLGFLARFLEETGDGNILSTPNLLTLDNEEARIVIGQNVPFITGQYTNNNTGAGSVNPFQTIERRDVGLTLRVKPQIGENGTVRLTIYQEVSSVQASTLNNASGPTTNKRTIESNVLVSDGGIVVLGGLLQDEFSGNQEKVPGLGDVPLLGNLFRSEARSRKKTNLMVFLRPVVVRDTRMADSLSLDRYDLMRSSQQATQPAPHGALDAVQGAPVLPQRPAAATPATTPTPATR